MQTSRRLTVPLNSRDAPVPLLVALLVLVPRVQRSARHHDGQSNSVHAVFVLQ